ncbi:hypothetical protein ANN_24002 [Periplaneta americana]|uniref:Odorant receptor n=1 Tax=Periplaneta americana TaxID=6978 RepID=A0ABQ8S1V1_PERAM|nr:hypothetical protein ANN_24002 [Periplaneta americana]
MQRLVKCFVWSVAFFEGVTWTLRRREEKRIEAFEMWIWKRMEFVKWTDRIKNEAVLERVGEERMMLELTKKRKRNWLGHWQKIGKIGDYWVCSKKPTHGLRILNLEVDTHNRENFLNSATGIIYWKAVLQHNSYTRYFSWGEIMGNTAICKKIPESFKRPNILGLNLKLFKLCGFLPDDDMTAWGRARCALLQGFMVFLHFQHTAGASVELYLSLDEADLQYTSDCFIAVIIHIKDLFKPLPLLVSCKKFQQLFYSIDNHFIPGIEPTESDRQLVETYMNRSRKISTRVWIAYLAVQIAFFVNMPPRPDIPQVHNLTQAENVKNVRRRSAIKTWFPFRAVESPYYELLAVYENVTMVIYLAFITLMNTTFLVLIIQATAQLALLAETLNTASQRVAEKLSNTAKNDMLPTSVQHESNQSLQMLNRDAEEVLIGGICLSRRLYQEEMQRYLGCCVQQHQKILKIVEELDAVLSVVMMMIILSSAALFAFLGIRLASATDSAVIVMSVAALACCVMETGHICWIANNLTTQSEMVGQDAYSCGWYDASQKFNTSIALIIMRAQRPAQMSVGPFGTLSLELFGKRIAHQISAVEPTDMWSPKQLERQRPERTCGEPNWALRPHDNQGNALLEPHRLLIELAQQSRCPNPLALKPKTITLRAQKSAFLSGCDLCTLCSHIDLHVSLYL